MKKLYTFLFALIALCSTASAQITGLNVGYCDGQLQTSTDQSFGTKEKNTWVSGAIYMPATASTLSAWDWPRSWASAR